MSVNDVWDINFNFKDIVYERHISMGIVKISFNRPEVRNAFTPQTVDELYQALKIASNDPSIGVVILTGKGPSKKDGGWAFCSGGDQRVRGPHGYMKEENIPNSGKLHILECQRLIRFMPKVVICAVNGWAAGGGHSLHVICDLTIASRQHAKFKQTDADVASFDGGYGSAYLAKMVGQKKAREIFFTGRTYSAQEAYEMGMVNKVVDHEELDQECIDFAKDILRKSPTAIKMLKYAFNLVDDGLVGQQIFAGEATRLAYAQEEAVEGRNSFLEKRDPDFSDFPWNF